MPRPGGAIFCDWCFAPLDARQHGNGDRALCARCRAESLDIREHDTFRPQESGEYVQGLGRDSRGREIVYRATESEMQDMSEMRKALGKPHVWRDGKWRKE